MEIFEQILKTDLTGDMLIVADVCGIEAARKMLSEISGISIYVPKLPRLELFIKRYLSENQGKNVKDMARELGVSEYYLRKFH